MGYKITPRRNLPAKYRNSIYRIINGGKLPVRHEECPPIDVGDLLDYEVMCEEISNRLKELKRRMRLHGTGVLL